MKNEFSASESKLLASIVENAAKLNRTNKMLLLIYGRGLCDGEESAKAREVTA